MPSAVDKNCSYAKPDISSEPGYSTPPERLASVTNLSRQEAAWRAKTVSVSSLNVDIDLTTATDQQDFAVTSTIVLDIKTACKGLWIDFIGKDIVQVKIDGNTQSITWDKARIILPLLNEGMHTIIVQARGLYSNTGQGLHRFYDPVDGEVYLYTHFEPSDARKAWPCLDQPDLKAPFTITAHHPKKWNILSNGTPVEVYEAADKNNITTFSATLPLPSYLTALAAGSWHRVSDYWTSTLRPEQLPVEVSWSCRASLANYLDSEELLAITSQGMSLYDEAYDYPYPWGSYDSVLVPEYNLGAMENPGCVTFNEDAYLFRGPVTAAQHAGRANTILHEMCHMWFGDLVTPRWWEDTWLKESFAENQGTWAQTVATQWKQAWATFALGRKAWAYSEDSRPLTTHPIVANVDDIEAARQTFDGITYAKGAAVIKQLVAYLGQETFLTAVRMWFKKYAFTNADLTQFLDTLSEASGLNMKAWADAWLCTSGPSIITDELETDGKTITSLRVTQHGIDPTSGKTVIRPHNLVIGLYYFESGILKRVHRLPLELTSAIAEVSPAVGLPVPDLVTVNDEDLTYAIIRPDKISLSTAKKSLSCVKDPLTRALWWSSLDNLVRDALLDPVEYITTVLTQADNDTQPATLTSLLTQACHYAIGYVSKVNYTNSLSMLTGYCADAQINAWELLRLAPPGSDAQLVRARAWIEAAGYSALLGDTAVAQAALRLREITAETLPGLILDTDLRWRCLIALARLGQVSSAELDQAKAADPSASGRTHYLQATASLPQPGVKETVFRRVLAERTLSNDHLDALLAGFAVKSHHQLTKTYTQPYLDALVEVWGSRGQEIATRIVCGLFPAYGDADDLELVDKWLAEHQDAVDLSALRRLVLKGRDDLARALRARQMFLNQKRREL